MNALDGIIDAVNAEEESKAMTFAEAVVVGKKKSKRRKGK